MSIIPRTGNVEVEVSQKEGIVLVSRLVSIYLFVWMLSDLTYVPERLFSFVHYAHERSVLASHNCFYSLDSFSLGFHLLRIVLLLSASVWFYRCGPTIQALFVNRNQQ